MSNREAEIVHIQTQAAKIWNYGINWVDSVKRI